MNRPFRPGRTMFLKSGVGRGRSSERATAAPAVFLKTYTGNDECSKDNLNTSGDRENSAALTGPLKLLLAVEVLLRGVPTAINCSDGPAAPSSGSTSNVAYVACETTQLDWVVKT